MYDTQNADKGPQFLRSESMTSSNSFRTRVHEGLSRILLMLSWQMSFMKFLGGVSSQYWMVTSEFLQNMDARVGEEPASNSFNYYTRVYALRPTLERKKIDMWVKEVMFWLT